MTSSSKPILSNKKSTTSKLKETPLEKQKRKFSQLLNTVERMKQDQVLREAQLQEVRKRIDQEIKPLFQKMLDKRLKINEVLEDLMGRKGFTRKEKRILRDVLFYNCQILSETLGVDTEEVVQRHMTNKQRQQMEEEEEARRMVEEQMNDFFEQMNQRFEEARQEAAEPEKEIRSRRKSKKTEESDESAHRPFVPDLSKEEQTKIDLQRHMRVLYLQLIKTIHPDREPDAAKRAQKTALMQQITVAYEKLDLFELLKARRDLYELEYAPETGKETAPAEELEQLKKYIQILEHQVGALQMERFQQHVHSPDSVLLRKFVGAGASMDKQFEKEQKQIKKEIKKLDAFQQMLVDPEEVKPLLLILDESPTISGYL